MNPHQEKLQRYETALSWLDPDQQLEILERPRSKEALQALVSEQAPMGLIARFAPLVKRAAELDPSSFDSLLPHIKEVEEQIIQGRAAWQKSIAEKQDNIKKAEAEVQQGHAEVFEPLISYYEHHNDIAKVKEYIHLALQYGLTGFYIRLGALQRKENDKEGALRSYRNAFRAGHIPNALKPLLELLHETGAEKEADEICNQLLSKKDRRGFLGKAYLSNMTGASLESILDQAEAAGTPLPIMIIRILYKERGKPDETIAYFEKRVAQDPIIHFFLANLYFQNKNFRKVRAHFNGGVRKLQLDEVMKQAKRAKAAGNNIQAHTLLVKALLPVFTRDQKMSAQEADGIVELVVKSVLN